MGVRKLIDKWLALGYTLPSATGTNTQVLQTNASAVLSWATVSGVSNSVRLLLSGGDMSTVSTTFVDLSAAEAASVTLVTLANPVLIIFQVIALKAESGAIFFDIAIDGTRQGGTYGLFTDAVDTNNRGVSINYLTGVLSAGSHTFKIQWKVGDGTGSVQCDADAPLHFAAIEQT